MPLANIAANRILPRGPWALHHLHQAPAKEKDALPVSEGEELATDKTAPKTHMRLQGG